MIGIKLINGLSNGKWVSTQTQARRPKKIAFSRKIKQMSHPPLRFNNSNVSQFLYQKHLGIFLDSQLTFEEHSKVITTKINKTIRLIRKFQNVLLRPALMTIYKAFVRAHLDYGDVIYDEAYNDIFRQKRQSIQYNACSSLSISIRGSSIEKPYQ